MIFIHCFCQSQTARVFSWKPTISFTCASSKCVSLALSSGLGSVISYLPGLHAVFTEHQHFRSSSYLPWARFNSAHWASIAQTRLQLQSGPFVLVWWIFWAKSLSASHLLTTSPRSLHITIQCPCYSLSSTNPPQALLIGFSLCPVCVYPEYLYGGSVMAKWGNSRTYTKL